MNIPNSQIDCAKKEIRELLAALLEVEGEIACVLDRNDPQQRFEGYVALEPAEAMLEEQIADLVQDHGLPDGLTDDERTDVARVVQTVGDRREQKHREQRRLSPPFMTVIELLEASERQDDCASELRRQMVAEQERRGGR